MWNNEIKTAFNDFKWDIEDGFVYSSIAQELRNFTDGQFSSLTYNLVKSLTFEMHKEFKQTGIYFTNEAQDSSDFEGVRCNNSAQLWQFDYALIPLVLEKLYSKIPPTHKVKRHESYLEAWSIDTWKDEIGR